MTSYFVAGMLTVIAILLVNIYGSIKKFQENFTFEIDLGDDNDANS